MSVRLDTRGDAAIVTMESPPVNAINQAIRQGLLDTFTALKSNADVSRVILTGAGTAFAAGADAKEFDKPSLDPQLPDVVAAIEACGKPVIAAIDGPALGGGYELALACTYRVATLRSSVGLPEVNLGVVPGSGGTQKLPRLIGMAKAVSLIAEGRVVKAPDAMKLGMVDAVADDPVNFAMTLDLESLHAITPLICRPMPQPDSDAVALAEKAAAKRKRGEQAPLRAANLVAASAVLQPEEALARERAAFLELRESDQARALRHMFFAERAAKAPASLRDVDPVDIGVAVVVGGGTMGASIAYALNGIGIDVSIVEMDAEAKARAEANVKKLFDDAVKRGLADQEAADASRERMSVLIGYDTLPPADIAIEAAFEDMAVKKQIFTSLEQSLPASAILATNTSYLDVNDIASVVSDKARVVGLHFFSPAHIMKLLEIVSADATGPVALATGFELARRLRKVPVLAGVCDGFIGNRILARYREIADITMIDGATPWEIDAAMVAFGYPMGPYMAQDLSGLDIAYANRQRQAPLRDPKRRYVRIGDRLVEDGRLGRKTGAGWYRYVDGKPEPDPLVEKMIAEEAHAAGVERRTFDPTEISDRIITAMINEAFEILDEGIAAKPSDIDLVLVHGYGFPRWRGGLMHEAAARGLDSVLASIETFAEKDPVIWTPSPLLRSMVRDGIGRGDFAAAKN